MRKWLLNFSISHSNCHSSWHITRAGSCGDESLSLWFSLKVQGRVRTYYPKTKAVCFSLPGRSQSPAHMFPIILTLTWLKRHSEEICERILKRHDILLFIFPFSYWINNLKQSRKSVQFCHPVMSDSLQPHEPQDTRPPYPSPTPRVYPNSCPLSQWCYPTISSSFAPFSSCPLS